MVLCKWRVIANCTQKLNSATWFKPIPVLEAVVAVKRSFSILEMNPVGEEPKQNIGGRFVAHRNRQLQKCLQGQVDVSTRIQNLQRAMNWKRDQV